MESASYTVIKYRKFTKCFGVDVLRLGTDFAEFPAKQPKHCGHCVFLQYSHTRKLGTILIYYGMVYIF